MELEEAEIQDNDVYFNRPSLLMRNKVMLVDLIILLALMYLISIILSNMTSVSDNTRMACLGLIIFYEPILISLGGTIGQRVLGLRVIQSSKYKRNGIKKTLNIFYSLIRYVFKIFLGWISLLTIHYTDYGQAIHDKMGNSIMIFR